MRILLFVIICLSIISCSDDNCTPETYSSTWTSDKTIVITYDSVSQQNRYNVENGNNLVFEYNHSGAECIDIDDDEWGEKLIFEIPIGVNNFEYTDAEIINANCFYQEYGAWVSPLHREITEGILKGEKLTDNIWQITANVKSIGDSTKLEKTIDFVAIFEQ